MGERTEIAWTDHTWNPWQGCHKVSEACANCYMYRDKKRYGQDASTVVRSRPGTFKAPLKWREPARVFTCSWSDFFIEEADEWRDDAWEIIRQTPHLTYQILTKRIERADECLPADWPLPNVWLGTSIESDRYSFRADHLRRTPAAVRFISAEPLLGPLPSLDLTGIDWLIVGGESGPGSRPMHADWARDLRDRCEGTDTAFHFKQWGEHDGTSVRVGKHAAGRELDGRTWDEFPVSAA